MALTVPQDRMAGFRGAVYLGGTAAASGIKILDIFDWTLEAVQEVVPCPIKGEVHDRNAAGGVTSRITAQRYVTDVALNLNAAGPPANAQGGSVFGSALGSNIPASGASWKGVSVKYSLYTNDAVTNQGFFITGEGFISRITANNPRGMASEVLEIVGDIMPTWSN